MSESPIEFKARKSYILVGVEVVRMETRKVDHPIRTVAIIEIEPEPGVNHYDWLENVHVVSKDRRDRRVWIVRGVTTTWGLGKEVIELSALLTDEDPDVITPLKEAAPELSRVELLISEIEREERSDSKE